MKLQMYFYSICIIIFIQSINAQTPSINNWRDYITNIDFDYNTFTQNIDHQIDSIIQFDPNFDMDEHEDDFSEYCLSPLNDWTVC